MPDWDQWEQFWLQAGWRHRNGRWEVIPSAEMERLAHEGIIESPTPHFPILSPNGGIEGYYRPSRPPPDDPDRYNPYAATSGAGPTSGPSAPEEEAEPTPPLTGYVGMSATNIVVMQMLGDVTGVDQIPTIRRKVATSSR